MTSPLGYISKIHLEYPLKLQYFNTKPTDEGLNSMKKVKKKGSSSKCSYCSKGFHAKNKCFKKKMDIMAQLLEKHNIDVPDELEKPAESLEHYHSAHS